MESLIPPYKKLKWIPSTPNRASPTSPTNAVPGRPEGVIALRAVPGQSLRGTDLVLRQRISSVADDSKSNSVRRFRHRAGCPTRGIPAAHATAG